jgi:hypothetical protein
MGVEWNIGCIKCKRQIWLGSQKPFKWQGFQIGEQSIKRFLYLHSKCENSLAGNLLLTNDGALQIPWDAEDERFEWQEDILSRSFCFDSWNQSTTICANCKKELEPDKNNRKFAGNVMKGEYLWFCDNHCFSNYVEYKRTEREEFIYDSTEDAMPPSIEGLFEIGCTKCKEYVIIDNKQTPSEPARIRNFEYLALFFCEHIEQDHILKLNIDNQNILWRQAEFAKEWKEFEY